MDGSGACYVTGDVNADGYLEKYSSDGVFQWSVRLGGTGNESCTAVALDGNGNCYVTGFTNSNGWTNGGWDTILNDGESTNRDAYVVKLNNDGVHLWSSYLGGTGIDYGNGIAVGSSGANIWVTGYTTSSNWAVNGWRTTYGGNVDAFVAKIVDTSITEPPAAPSNPGSEVADPDAITWIWQDNSYDETGFKVYADEGNTAPITVTHITDADVEAWRQDGLSPNTQYAMQVAATNAHGDSGKTPNHTAWTLIEPVAGLAFSGVTPTSISVAATNVPSNLSAGDSGLQFSNTTAGQASAWQQDTMPWTSAGLTPNTLYEFSGQSRNAVSIESISSIDTHYTLAAAPAIGNNLSADKIPGVPYPATTAFLFSNPAGFGTGAHGGTPHKVSGFLYAWDTNDAHSFSGMEPEWNADVLALSPTVSGTYYLHVQALNEAGLAGDTLDYGPFIYDAEPPNPPVVSGPVLTNNPRPTWTWTPGGGGNGTYKYELDVSGIWVETTDTAFTPAEDLTEGPHTLRLRERDDAGNWSARSFFDVFVDLTPPEPPVVSGPVLINTARPTWTWMSGGDGNGTYEYELDASGLWVETTDTAFTPAEDLPEGMHTLRVRECDDAGNWSDDGSHTITISTAALGAALHLAGPVETGADSVAFAVTFSREVVPTFNATAISITGSLAGSLLVSGTDPEYIVTVTLTDPDADGTVGISVEGGAVQDAYGNVYAGGASPQYQVYNWHMPWFTEAPENARKYTGDNQTLSVAANCGASAITYQWKWNDGAKTEHLGPASPTWTLTGVTPAQAGNYWCEATYDGSTHATPPVSLEVHAPLQIIQQPQGGQTFVGGNHEFTVIAEGGYAPLHYQWLKDGSVLIDMPDMPIGILSDLKETDSGRYTVVVTDDNGMMVESEPAELLVAAGLAGPGRFLLALLAFFLATTGTLVLQYGKRIKPTLYCPK